jgi:hypothetical protein
MSRDLYQDLTQPALTAYLEGLIPPRPPVLQEMETYAAGRRFPIVGPVVGQLFYLLTRASGLLFTAIGLVLIVTAVLE